jgi:hypothetical protein
MRVQSNVMLCAPASSAMLGWHQKRPTRLWTPRRRATARLSTLAPGTLRNVLALPKVLVPPPPLTFRAQAISYDPATNLVVVAGSLSGTVAVFEVDGWDCAPATGFKDVVVEPSVRPSRGLEL